MHNHKNGKIEELNDGGFYHASAIMQDTGWLFKANTKR